jgi:hypothetical protein
METMTTYTITAWCDQPFVAKCEVEADSPQEALTKARTAILEEPAECCDPEYHWDSWVVDSEEKEEELCHTDQPLRLREAAPRLLAALQEVVRSERDRDEESRNLSEERLAEFEALVNEATGGAA